MLPHPSGIGLEVTLLAVGVGIGLLAILIGSLVVRMDSEVATPNSQFEEGNAVSNRTRLALMNEALSVCSVGHIPFDQPGSRQTFGLGPEALNIVGDENRRAFDQIIRKLLDGIAGSMSKARLTELLVPALQSKKKVLANFTSDECDVFWRDIDAIPDAQYRVFREIFGATLPQAPNPISISCFTIYDWSRHKARITEPNITNDSWVWNQSQHGILAECKVQAKDQQKALELADILFGKFESAIRFMIGHRTERFEFGILNYAGSRLSQHYMFKDGHVSVGHARKGPSDLIPLDDDYFSKPSAEFERLLTLLESQRNNLERRILKSVEWTAQALMDLNPASAFIKAATALEVLFSANEKGVVTPSIMAQISESCAHILGNTPETCIEVEATVKRLYGIRSAVVHSGKDSVPEDDLGTFIYIARSVVLELLQNNIYRDVESIEKLHELLKVKKYTTHDDS